MLKRIFYVIFQMDKQVIWTGIFAVLYGTFCSIFNCILRHTVYKGQNSKFIDFISGFISSTVLLRVCFSKPYRKIVMYFTTALAFDVLIKLLFNKHK